jgi:hypothetical protein
LHARSCSFEEEEEEEEEEEAARRDVVACVGSSNHHKTLLAECAPKHTHGVPTFQLDFSTEIHENAKDPGGAA